ncbi:MAG: hypothetical protein M0Q00_04375 [Acholeplasmataceae bacterium]|nr:hypothetical protein [Acholeplasmataceae bacterium]
MTWYQILFLVLISFFLLLMLFNPKIRLFSLIVKQWKVFVKYNPDKVQQKISIIDMISFIIAPVLISSILVWGFAFIFTVDVASLLVTVFSIIFTVLFGFISVLVGKASSSNKIEKQLVSETFTSIVSAMLLAIISAILLIVYVSTSRNAIFDRVISNIVIWFSIESLLLLLMITKRSYVIFSKANDE